jgi:hypothetical protein
VWRRKKETKKKKKKKKNRINMEICGKQKSDVAVFGEG